MKILTASKSSVDIGSPSNYVEISAKPFADSVIPARKSVESLKTKPYLPTGKNRSLCDEY